MATSFSKLIWLSAFVFCPTAPSAIAQVNLVRNGDHIEISVGGHSFATYHFEAAVAKPYLSPLRSAEGTIVTRGFPMIENIPDEDHDEPHQRAMYFAHGDI